LSPEEERLRALVESGWLPTVGTHLAGLRQVEKWGLAGPWMTWGDQVAGWVIYLRPSPSLAKRGATSRRTNMRATLAESVSDAEQHAERESVRLHIKENT
jgi:hypothetical protein